MLKMFQIQGVFICTGRGYSTCPNEMYWHQEIEVTPQIKFYSKITSDWRLRGA